MSGQIRTCRTNICSPRRIQEAYAFHASEHAKTDSMKGYHVTVVYKPRSHGKMEDPVWADKKLRTSIPMICSALMGRNYQRRNFQAYAFLDEPGSRNGNPQKQHEPFDVAYSYHHHIILLADSGAAGAIDQYITGLSESQRCPTSGVFFQPKNSEAIRNCYIQPIGTQEEIEFVTSYAAKGLKTTLARYHDEAMYLFPESRRQ